MQEIVPVGDGRRHGSAARGCFKIGGLHLQRYGAAAIAGAFATAPDLCDERSEFRDHPPGLDGVSRGARGTAVWLDGPSWDGWLFRCWPSDARLPGRAAQLRMSSRARPS